MKIIVDAFGGDHAPLAVIEGCRQAVDELGAEILLTGDEEKIRQAAAMGHTEYDESHVTVTPVTTAEYGVSKAARPFNSRLDRSKLTANGFTPLPTWQDAVARYLKEIEF